MDHDRPMFLAVTPDIIEIKPLREGEIALDCSTLPLPVKSVLQLDIDLRTIESAVTFVDLIRQAGVIKSTLQSLGRALPIFVGADGFFRAR